MLPMLRPKRDAVELIELRTAPGRGDIILYLRENGQYVLHRIIAVKETGYLCSGDNQHVREPVTRDQILAVVDGFIRKGKHRSIRDFGYRLYKTLWLWGFPLRGVYIALRRRLGKLRRKWKKRKNP